MLLACVNDNIEFVQYLLDRGADMDAVTNHDWKPIHVASRHGQVKVAQLLLQRGADYKAYDDDARTPLHLACNNQQPDLI